MIDVHVHLRDGEQANKETLLHGMRVGVACGIQAFFDMPNTAVPLTTETAIRERLVAGAKAAALVKGYTPFYGVYGGITTHISQILSMVELHRKLFPNMVGLKMFGGHSTGNMGIVNNADQKLVYKTLAEAEYTGVLAVHCEKEALLRPELWDPNNPVSHTWARPAEAEVSSIADHITYAQELNFRGTLHICHISTGKSIELVNQARAQGMRISCGATPHHALLNDALAGTKGNLLKMNPPLRSEADRKAVFQALCEGRIDWIESDHAPHTLEDKAEGASGIPGFVGMVLLVNRLQQAGVSQSTLEQLCGKRACRTFGIDLPVEVPNLADQGETLLRMRSAYPWDPFASLDRG